ncbi:hypothetical protein NP493_47g05036 [Ridgeia piscesae]|uniref:Malic enzyme n=1 Tax=Ridgeia piscesae TaxID=27915 RepID=A0AAD9UJD7_RIDPI|nr:hypothetical protein NP493_47g05036 [Ridgeia piscesae]
MASTQITKIIGTRTLSVCNRSLATSFFTRNQRFHTSARSQLPDGPIPRKHERLLGDVHSRGIGVLRDPRFNKGMAFTLEERQILGIHGLLPPAVFSMEEQVRRTVENVRKLANPINQYVYMLSLLQRNEKLFFKVVTENVEEMSPILYTPTVGLACQTLGHVYQRPRGMYITINDKNHIFKMLCNYPEHHIKAVVMTDGERILGLGDLGAFGMGIPIGKLNLYTAMGGIPPHQCLPVMLDVGTNNEQLRNQDTYFGIRQERVTGDQYDEFIDEFLAAVVHRYGQTTLLQFEDFANHNAFRLLEKYRNKYLTFNDDIQGTASVCVAGIMAAMRITKKKLPDNTFLFFGAGEAAIGIAELLVTAMTQEGMPEKEARSKIWLIDKAGLLVQVGGGRSEGASPEKIPFLKEHKEMNDLLEITKHLKPSVVVGAAGVGQMFDKAFLNEMAANNERPVIFALSNPTSHSECTAQEAYDHTQGRCVFASGSPFPPVSYNGKTYHTGQGNNAYIFPGVALAAIVASMHHISEEVFFIAAKVIADLAEESDLEMGRIYPPLANIHEVSTNLAAKIVEYAYANNIACTYPEPVDKLAFVRAHQFSLEYESFVPQVYSWPQQK